MSHDLSVDLIGITPMVFRAPIEIPVQTSFGIMRDRPMLLIRVEDRSGSHGWGEVWCNFPAVGAEHRARLITSVFAPLMTERSYETPQLAFGSLEKALATLSIQSGEAGPLAQCLAGIDIAIWDMVARRNGVSIAAVLGGETPDAVPCYASGINPNDARQTVARARDEGFSAFKLKVGFGEATDIGNLDAICADMSTSEILMTDANQGWSLTEALAMLEVLARYDLTWLEEPIAADSSLDDWGRLRSASEIPLAAGENIRGLREFEAVLSAGHLRVVQPDIAKWGGFSCGLPVVQRILATGHRYCPHWLGGGIGLIASAHLLASSGSDGALEVDINVNPLRPALLPGPDFERGMMRLPKGVGLGVEPDIGALAPFGVV
ncbi:mandelate racemase/muconate lactonizing enzyme family protein [Devosia nitrariae]|uniref:Mandelate racemase n=1 Tax=Devosia nitrariae TaxID=2071872 RepID=A0ABQ5W7T1_9HYPH|nr:mandelate racemase/muconate lactonizing enzyme family protein [Devosia nitrariae]GLQ55823.1 mandelate racemase [Devosia nitrariae]